MSTDARQAFVPALPQKLLAEFAGTAALLCAAHWLRHHGRAPERWQQRCVALLANTLATVFALYVLIETLGPISRAHFNPAGHADCVVKRHAGPRKTIASSYIIHSISITGRTGRRLGCAPDV